MKNIRTPITACTLAISLWLLAASSAPAYFDPTIGRWASRDPIQESGGLNLYGLVGNRPLDRTDLLGLDIVCECAIEGYFADLGMPPSIWSKTGQNTYSAKAGVPANLFDGKGEAEIVWKMLRTKHTFKAARLKLTELKRHVQARMQIVRNAWNARFSWKADDASPDVFYFTGPYRDEIIRVGWNTFFTQHPDLFFETINNEHTLVRCYNANLYIFESGNMWTGRAQRLNDNIFIPGDWPYLDNAVQTATPGDWDPGFEGQNLIHVGADQFYGHPAGVQTEDKWMETIRGWQSRSGYFGIPAWGNPDDNAKGPAMIRYPSVGLDR